MCQIKSPVGVRCSCFFTVSLIASVLTDMHMHSTWKPRPRSVREMCGKLQLLNTSARGRGSYLRWSPRRPACGVQSLSSKASVCDLCDTTLPVLKRRGPAMPANSVHHYSGATLLGPTRYLLDQVQGPGLTTTSVSNTVSTDNTVSCMLLRYYS